MARKAGSKNKATANVREKIERAFIRVNNPAISGRETSWLEYQAWNNPAVFAGLVAKVIPNEVKLDIAHTINLGDAMAIAAERIKQLEHDNNVNLLDITPETSEIVSDDTKEKVSSDVKKLDRRYGGGHPKD